MVEASSNSTDCAKRIRYVFDLYAHQNCTIDMIGERLLREGVKYTDTQPKWPRSKIGKILRDRAYIGEIFYRSQWHPGAHPPIVDRVVWDRVQVLLGEKTYKSHELTYAGEIIRCGHCGRPITGESVVKPETGREYATTAVRGTTRRVILESASASRNSISKSWRCWRGSSSRMRCGTGSPTCCDCGFRMSSSNRAQPPMTSSAN
jgi:hypothetical protein